jgi:heat shock protein HtpX
MRTSAGFLFIAAINFGKVKAMTGSKADLERQISHLVSEFLQFQLGENAGSVLTLLKSNAVAVRATDCLAPLEKKLAQNEDDWRLLQNFKSRQFVHTQSLLKQKLEEMTGAEVLSIVTTVDPDGLRWEVFTFSEDLEKKLHSPKRRIVMNTMKTFMLMAGLTALLIVIGNWLGGQTGMFIALGFALLMNFGSYWFSDKIVLKMYNAQEVSPSSELYATVRTLATKAGLPMPKVYLIPGEQPNAFATGRNPEHAAVAVTEGITRMLNRNELAGVIGHELAHIKNRDILIGTIAATIAGAISMIANIAQFSMLFGGGRSDDEEGSNPIASLVMIIVAPIAAMLIQMAVSRSREYIADEDGARIAGDPRYLSNALRKLHTAAEQIPMAATPATAHMFIVSPLSGGGAIMNLFSTHPPMEKRVERLESMQRF